MEHVLIWPSQYPLLLRGLIEQNGAFILDALESWPNCKTSKDEQGVETTVLPPLFYLQWLKPLEPFESCYFQHIDEYDEQQQSYTQQLFAHIEQSGMTREELTIMLLKRVSQYSDLMLQKDAVASPNFFDLLVSLKYDQVFNWCLESGMKLTALETCRMWEQKDFKVAIEQHIATCISEPDKTAQMATDKLLQDSGEFYHLLELVYDDKAQIEQLLEQALLNQVMSDDVKQPKLMNLLAQGAKGSERDAQGRTALMWAVEKGFVNVVEKLLPNHDVNEIDEQGQTLMHFAVKSNLASMIDLIMNQGVEATKPDSLGQSPYRLAMKLSLVVAKKTLEQHGIKELSEQGKLVKIKQVHFLYALVSLLLPVQLALFFSEQVADKSLLVWGATGVGVLLFWFARWVRRGQLYPNMSHPWSLKGLSALSWFSVSAQVLFALLILSTLLRG
ncbi:ankyrin repeat domain-containing protein [Pseudoalteromonas sp. JBTF-M23]|uniref:Ankyrin repeat domain-containing protein n=1 Tax=Pseudoalteromonas caenipelagi TaxID=2726988 RepID=A0A849VC55_9GAMM|nr:ankyrin repeat domain-containing protein [Pseudoalteromonas caenipelagi]NOU50866.1 ankyrin repeat domain-containing protein [Pseudoalteromonas caenipelagi]